MSNAAASQSPLQGLAALLEQATQLQRQTAADNVGERFHDTMDSIMAAYARAKIQRIEILNHNGSMLGHVDKMAMANAMGLDEKQRLGVTPFPTPTSINISGPDPQVAQQLQQGLEALRSQLANLQQTRPDPRQPDPMSNATSQSAPVNTSRPTNEPAPVEVPVASSPSTLWSKVWPLALAAGLGVGGTAATMYATRPAPTGQGSVDLEVEGWQATPQKPAPSTVP